MVVDYERVSRVDARLASSVRRAVRVGAGSRADSRATRIGLPTSRKSPAVTTISGVASSASGSVRTAAAGMPSGRSLASQPAAVSAASAAVTTAEHLVAARGALGHRREALDAGLSGEGPPEPVMGDEQRQVAVGGRKQLRGNVVRVRAVRLPLRLDAVVEVGRRRGSSAARACTSRSETSTWPPRPETICASSPSAAVSPVELSADE